jgi:hypothetical protein
MSDTDRVRGWFASGALLPPAPALPNSVDLGCAIASLCGVDDSIETPGAKEIAAALGETEHLVVVLIDGLGLNLIESLPPDAFLRRHLALELRAVFPATTAAALTSLATGRWPAQHAVPAWWLYLPEHGLTATVLPFVERFSERPLGELGVRAGETFREPALMASFARDAVSLLPEGIAGSVYTVYVAGGTPVRGYRDLAGGIDAVIARVSAARAPTYTYLYYPTLDTIEHARGHQSAEARAELLRVDRELARLAAAIAGRGRLAVSADHGQIEVADAGKRFLEPGDGVHGLLAAPAYGEPRVPFFRARDGAADAFAAAFRERHGDPFALLSIDEADELRLFGPAPLSATARGRIGDYVGIAATAEVILDASLRGRGPALMRGFHAGMLPDEMRIPLVVA